MNCLEPVSPVYVRPLLCTPTRAVCSISPWDLFSKLSRLREPCACTEGTRTAASPTASAACRRRAGGVRRAASAGPVPGAPGRRSRRPPPLRRPLGRQARCNAGQAPGPGGPALQGSPGRGCPLPGGQACAPGAPAPRPRRPPAQRPGAPQRPLPPNQVCRLGAQGGPPCPAPALKAEGAAAPGCARVELLSPPPPPPPPPPQNLLRRERWQAGRPRPAGPAPAPRAAGACGGSAAAPRTSLPVQPAGCQVRRPGPPAMNAGHAPGSAGSRAGAALSRPGAAPHAALRAVARRCFPAARSPAVQEKIQRRNGVQSKLRSRQAGAEGERDGAWRCKAFGCIRGQMGRPPTWSRSVPRRSSPESCLPAAPGAAAPDQPA